MKKCCILVGLFCCHHDKIGFVLNKKNKDELGKNKGVLGNNLEDEEIIFQAKPLAIFSLYTIEVRFC